MKKTCIPALLAASIASISLSGCTIAQREAHKATHLEHMSEGRLEHKTEVKTRPWLPFIIVTQQHAYSYFSPNQFNAWLQAMIVKKDGAITKPGGGSYKAGDVIYMIGAALSNMPDNYSHIEYQDASGRKYTKIMASNDQRQCWQQSSTDASGRLYDNGEQTCIDDSTLLVPIRDSTMQYIMSDQQAWHVTFVPNSDSWPSLDDVVTASEAQALVDRVQEIRANLNNLNEPGEQEYQP